MQIFSVGFPARYYYYYYIFYEPKKNTVHLTHRAPLYSYRPRLWKKKKLRLTRPCNMQNTRSWQMYLIPPRSLFVLLFIVMLNACVKYNGLCGEVNLLENEKSNEWTLLHSLSNERLELKSQIYTLGFRSLKFRWFLLFSFLYIIFARSP